MSTPPAQLSHDGRGAGGVWKLTSHQRATAPVEGAVLSGPIEPHLQRERVPVGGPIALELKLIGPRLENTQIQDEQGQSSTSDCETEREAHVEEILPEDNPGPDRHHPGPKQRNAADERERRQDLRDEKLKQRLPDILHQTHLHGCCFLLCADNAPYHGHSIMSRQTKKSHMGLFFLCNISIQPALQKKSAHHHLNFSPFETLRVQICTELASLLPLDFPLVLALQEFRNKKVR